MNFTDLFKQTDWNETRQRIYQKTEGDVLRALRKKGRRDLDDFMALISPAAAPYLEEMATVSHQMTQKRFGNTIQLYIPLYLSNKCCNSCLYCGFNTQNKIERVTLTAEEILEEVKVIKSLGFDHVLLVTGDGHKKAGIEYFEKALDLVRPHFSNISMEVQPLDQDQYEALIQKGLHSVMVYQETYSENYGVYHPAGPKSDFTYRLETPDRLGRAGVHKVGLGCLIGLEDWRVDSFFVGLHLDYLSRTYWKTKYSISFPRMRPAAGGFQVKSPISDREMVQLICAYRIFDENVEISLSTRESQLFRDNVARLGVTTMSAGSKTDPGGYASGKNELKQFEIDDDRSPQEVASALSNLGLAPVWKDWDMAYDSNYR